MKIKFIRFDQRAKLPERKHYSDTGADIYMMDGGTIEPGETQVIGLGFGVDIPNGYNCHMQNRTSIAKQGIYVHQAAIDAGYKGEIHLIVTNISKKTFTWNANDRLCYLEVYPCVYPEFVEFLGDEREDGAFGSTNKEK